MLSFFEASFFGTSVTYLPVLRVCSGFLCKDSSHRGSSRTYRPGEGAGGGGSVSEVK